MEIKTYRCPSCGAQITNDKNCEYCGSLLVRFEAKGIKVNDMSHYLKDDTILPGLLNELKQNLQIQEQGETAVTDIILPKINFKDGSWYNSEYSILPVFNMEWQNHEKILSSGKIGLGLEFNFTNYSGDLQEFQKYSHERHQRFKQMECYNLFQHRRFTAKELGRNDCDYLDEYILDFGKDAEGAAHLMSDIIRNVDTIDNEYGINYDTNKWSVITQHRNERYGTSDNNSNESSGWLGWIGWTVAAIIAYMIFF